MYKFSQILEFAYDTPISYEEYLSKWHNEYDIGNIIMTVNRKDNDNRRRLREDMQRYCRQRDFEVIDEEKVQISYKNYILYNLVVVAKIKGVSDLWICVLIRGLLYDTIFSYKGKTQKSGIKLRKKVQACVDIAWSPQAYLFVRFDKEYKEAFGDDVHYHHEISNQNVDCTTEREDNHKLSYLCFLLYFGNQDLYLHIEDVFTMNVYSQGEIARIANMFPQCDCGDVQNCLLCKNYVDSFLKGHIAGLYLDVRHIIPYFIQQDIYPKESDGDRQPTICSNSKYKEDKLGREDMQEQLLFFCDPFEVSEITVSGKIGKQEDYRTIKDRFPSAKITEQRYNGKTQYFKVENKLKYHNKKLDV